MKEKVQTYTRRANAVRGAQRAGLTADAVKPVAGKTGVWFVEGESKKAAKAPKPAKSGKKAAKPAPAERAPKLRGETPANRDGSYPREGSKNHTLMDMLTRLQPKPGATMAQLRETLGWVESGVRCAVQRVTRSYGYEWGSIKSQDGTPTRWIAWRKGEARPC